MFTTYFVFGILYLIKGVFGIYNVKEGVLMEMKDKKESLQSKEYCIKKSNEISMAELNYGLSLNQMQLLAFAIYSTQQDGSTEFQKHEFQKKFGIEQYRTEDAYEDSKKIMNLKVSTKNIENERFKFWN